MTIFVRRGRSNYNGGRTFPETGTTKRMTIVRVIPESSAEDSLAAVQVLCRLLLQASLMAIPTYLFLFMITVPFDINAGVGRGLILSTPVVEFAIAAILYSLALLIALPDGDRDHPDSLIRMKNWVIRRKIRLILLGSALFLVGILSGTLLLLKARL